MWKIALAAVGGFLGMVLIFAVGREFVFALQTRPAGTVFGDALSAMGSLKWMDTTLVTGLAAVTAAYLSVRAVRDQISQTAAIEADRNSARRIAVRASLGLALSTICDYAKNCAHQNRGLLQFCDDGRLRDGVDLPTYPAVPDTAVATIKEMIEFAEPENRRAFAKIAPALQVQAARLRGMAHDMELGFKPRKENVLDYIIDALEIYARCSVLFDYARDVPDAKARSLENGDIVRAVHNVILFTVFDHDIKASAIAREEYLAENGH